MPEVLFAQQILHRKYREPCLLRHCEATKQPRYFQHNLWGLLHQVENWFAITWRFATLIVKVTLTFQFPDHRLKGLLIPAQLLHLILYPFPEILYAYD